MAFKINVDSNSYSSQAEKLADSYVLSVARKLVGEEATARQRENMSLSTQIDSNQEAIESLNEFKASATEMLSEKELLKNKTEYISASPSHEKYPTEQAVAEFVAGLGEENGGHVHPNKQAIDAIDEEDIEKWDKAAENVGDIALSPLAQRMNSLIDDVNSAEAEIAAVSNQTTTIQEALSSAQEQLNSIEADIDALKAADSNITLVPSDTIIYSTTGISFSVKKSGTVRVFVGILNPNREQTVTLTINPEGNAGGDYAKTSKYFQLSDVTKELQLDLSVSPDIVYTASISGSYYATQEYLKIGACTVDSSLVY